MNDLIRRQEAINAILHYTIRIPGYMSEWGRKLIAAIKKDFMDDIEAIPPAQQWIPVSERLPEMAGIYLVTNSMIGYDELEITYFEDGEWDTVGIPIAWMPPPEPYKEVE